MIFYRVFVERPRGRRVADLVADGGGDVASLISEVRTKLVFPMTISDLVGVYLVDEKGVEKEVEQDQALEKRHAVYKLVLNTVRWLVFGFGFRKTFVFGT